MRIFLLSHARARRGSTVAAALARHGVTPAGFVFEAYQPLALRKRIAQRVATRGIPLLAPTARGNGATQAPHEAGPDAPPAADYARAHGMAAIELPDLRSKASLERLRGLRPDLFVHAGAGILRAPLLAIPRLGTLNAHMGLLPRYRGMNVAEWSALEGRQTGCTVHLLDPGIDTGDIIETRAVDTSDCRSIAELRARMDAAQLDFLGETVARIAAAGELPPTRPQAEDDGRQYFAMHAELKALLERRLENRQ